MLLIACSLALLVIYAGMKLLAQSKNETLGYFYKYVAWFIVIMGFLMLLGISCFSIVHFCHKGERKMESKFRMMEERQFQNNYMKDNKMGSCMKMGEHHGKMMGHSGGMMMGGGCCGEMDKCRQEHEACKEKTEGDCHHWRKGKGDEESDEDPMKKCDMPKKDSIKKNKNHR